MGEFYENIKKISRLWKFCENIAKKTSYNENLYAVEIWKLRAAQSKFYNNNL